VKEVSVLHERSFLIKIRYNLNTIDFITLDIIATKKNKEKCIDILHFKPKVAYTGKILTEKLKVKDWLSLCDSGLYHHDFYRTLSFE